MKIKRILTVAVICSAASIQAANWGLALGNWTTDAAAGWGTEPTAGDIANIFAGIVEITAGNAEVANELRLGNAASNTGTLNMSGGSLTHGSANVGLNGTGVVNITGGAITSAGSVSIGGGGAANGTITVDGSGSSWSAGNLLYVGSAATGSLAISNGGTFSNTFSHVGRTATGNGTVTVSGAGSSWVNSSAVQIGASGTGSLSISGGGRVDTIGTSFVGANAGSDGTVTISGAGSIWESAGQVRVGWNGTGLLTIEDGGRLQADSVSIQGGGAATGNINMGIGGLLTLGTAAGSDQSADIATFLGSTLVIGTDDIRYWNGASYVDITTGTEGVDYTLTYFTTGALTGYTELEIIPEPGTMGMLIVGCAGLIAVRRMRI